MSHITIYHNPKCSTSRNALALIEAAGIKPTVIDYMKTGWTRETLKSLLKAMKAKPRDILRVKNTPAEALGLTDPETSDEAILKAMIADPVLVERPIVVMQKGTVIARPMEKLTALLEG